MEIDTIVQLKAIGNADLILIKCTILRSDANFGDDKVLLTAIFTHFHHFNVAIAFLKLRGHNINTTSTIMFALKLIGTRAYRLQNLVMYMTP